MGKLFQINAGSVLTVESDLSRERREERSCTAGWSDWKKHALEQNLSPTPLHIALLPDTTTLMYSRQMLSDTKQSLL